MIKTHLMTEETLNSLLLWLDSDRDAAGEKYENVRLRLIKLFVCRGCFESEELADETINRVALKADELKPNYIGNPINYFLGVANNVYLEWQRKNRRFEAGESFHLRQTADSGNEEAELADQCLTSCLQKLPAEQRELILTYYQSQSSINKGRRERLSQKLGMELNALRVKVHRLRARLHNCLKSCLER